MYQYTLGSLGCIWGRNSKFYTIPERGHWKRPIYGRLALIGATIGYGTFIGLSQIVFEYKAVALIPCLFMFIFVGIPLFALELAIGHYINLGPVKAFSSLAPILSGIGWGMAVICITTAAYYSHYLTNSLFIFAYSVWHLMGFSSNQAIMRNKCTFLTNTESQPRELMEEQLMFFSLTWFFVAVIISKGYQSLGKVIFVLNALPYFLLTVLFIYKLRFPTSGNPQHFLDFSWGVLLDKNIWVNSAKHILFTLGIGHGIHCTIASYNKTNHSFLIDPIGIPLIDLITSIVCFYLIWERLGAEDNDMQRILCEFSDNMYQDHITVVIHLTFYLMSFSCLLAMVEVVVTAILDQFQVLRNCHSCVVYVTCSFIFVMGVSTFIYHDYFQFLLTTGTSVFVYFGLALSITGPFFYFQFDKVKKDLELKPNVIYEMYLKICWLVISPAILMVIAILHFMTTKEIYSWSETVCVAVCIIFPGIFTVVNCYPLKFKECFQATEKFSRISLLPAKPGHNDPEAEIAQRNGSNPINSISTVRVEGIGWGNVPDALQY